MAHTVPTGLCTYGTQVPGSRIVQMQQQGGAFTAGSTATPLSDEMIVPLLMTTFSQRAHQSFGTLLPPTAR